MTISANNLYQNGNSCDLLYKGPNCSYWDVPWEDADGVIGYVAVMSRKIVCILDKSKLGEHHARTYTT